MCLYHTDVPLTHSLPRSSSISSEYEPHPLAVLCHLATAVLRVASLHQAVERRRARGRSQQEPEWGLTEGREGVLVGLGGGGSSEEKKAGLVLDMELRRKSGRAVAERFVLAPGVVAATITTTTQQQKQAAGSKAEPSRVYLLSDHPAFRDPGDADQQEAGGEGEGDGEEMETTFNLGLTEKQRRDREGIVLPYFDAQQDIGAGEGGRILYEMGREDDFDDEEDEI